jgi:hypothetical protein
LKSFENWAQRRIFEPTKDEIIGDWRALLTRSLITSTLPQIFLELSTHVE